MEELIKKFWENSASEEEKRKLLKLIDDKNPRQFQKLRNEFELKSRSTQLIPKIKDEKFEKILNEIHKKIANQTKSRRNRTISIVSKIAAAILLILTFGWMIGNLGNSKSNQIIESQFSVIENIHSDKMMYFDLKDGSKVKLYPNSKISYGSAYGNENRNIHLEGKAFFKVAKNPDLAFVVESKNYFTTALGTEFTVDAFSDTIQIQLFEGKIIVKSSSQSKVDFEPVYLSPGEKLIIDEKSDAQKLYHPNFLTQKDQVERIDSEVINEDGILKFKQENLSEVFDELSKIYHKKITYHPEEIKGLTFTGDIYTQDELKNSIQILCNLNELKFTETENEILIRK